MNSNQDVKIASLEKTLATFISRYDADRHECADRYRQEYEEKKVWREAIDQRFEKLDTQLIDITSYLNQLRPKDKWLTTIISLVFIGAMGLIWKIIWDHVGK